MMPAISDIAIWSTLGVCAAVVMWFALGCIVGVAVGRVLRRRSVGQ